VSHSSTSAAEFGAENLLRPLSQIRLGLKRRDALCVIRDGGSVTVTVCAVPRAKAHTTSGQTTTGERAGLTGNGQLACH
jgi:hypothetical protein